MNKFALAAGMFFLGASAAQAEPPVCLQSHLIRDTKVTDEHTIMFHMLDGSVWKNTLVGACPELKFNGFSYVATPPDQICGNLQSIRVIHSGSVCLLGPFTQVAPAHS